MLAQTPQEVFLLGTTIFQIGENYFRGFKQNKVTVFPPCTQSLHSRKTKCSKTANKL